MVFIFYYKLEDYFIMSYMLCYNGHDVNICCLISCFFCFFLIFRAQFTEYVQKNVSLYQYRNNIPLTTNAAANFIRGELATALRKVQSILIIFRENNFMICFVFVYSFISKLFAVYGLSCIHYHILWVTECSLKC